MNLRCKAGDMAFISGGSKGTQIGKTVTCIALTNEPPFFSVHKNLWKVDVPIRWNTLSGKAREHYYVPDEYLTPITPKGDEDDLTVYKEKDKPKEKESEGT